METEAAFYRFIYGTMRDKIKSIEQSTKAPDHTIVSLKNGCSFAILRDPTPENIAMFKQLTEGASSRVVYHEGLYMFFSALATTNQNDTPQ